MDHADLMYGAQIMNVMALFTRSLRDITHRVPLYRLDLK